eukprot:6179328-Pleurochrysis_carterae.AAC.1
MARASLGRCVCRCRRRDGEAVGLMLKLLHSHSHDCRHARAQSKSRNSRPSRNSAGSMLGVWTARRTRSVRSGTCIRAHARHANRRGDAASRLGTCTFSVFCPGVPQQE